MFKEILEIDFSQLKKIINNPSQFLQQEFSLDLSNNEIYFLTFVILLFIVGVSFEALKPKNEVLDSDLPDNDYKSNEIASNKIIQKIDLANAYISMGKKTRAKTIIDRVQKKRMSKNEKKEINKLKKLLNE
ncbi:MAG: hypothetical protein CBC72_003155 [Gammaproteobacteria bacterium TMED112]|nr:MAG: hypothetical protein CBC72_003155 [Gammaproteobacteria bacterium TMED112]|tara:strand:- start:8783 stop:9175 length:393 start_codon:yes stop_codon:yes gene_type:complete